MRGLKANVLGAVLLLGLAMPAKADEKFFWPAAGDCPKIMRLEPLIGAKDFPLKDGSDALAWYELAGWLEGWWSAQSAPVKAGVTMTPSDMGMWIISWCREHPQAPLPIAAAALRDVPGQRSPSVDTAMTKAAKALCTSSPGFVSSDAVRGPTDIAPGVCHLIAVRQDFVGLNPLISLAYVSRFFLRPKEARRVHVFSPPGPAGKSYPPIVV
jgi:hypothetical protein